MSRNKEWIGPVYGVELMQNLAVSGGLQQAMPDRNELEWLRQYSERTVAAFEVLSDHYRQALIQRDGYKFALQNVLQVLGCDMEKVRECLSGSEFEIADKPSSEVQP